MLSLVVADATGLKWAQEQVIRYHYLHTAVDVRCRPLAYVVMLLDRPVGCLIFGRPEATKVTGWYGSLKDVQSGECPFTRWQILNLARIYLDPSIQRAGAFAHPEGLVGPSILPSFYDRHDRWQNAAASYVIDLALDIVTFDFLYHRPPVWMEQPYELAHIISYCDTKQHKGMLYRASHFEWVRTNTYGIDTYRRRSRPLTQPEHAMLAKRSQEDRRAQRLREVARVSYIKQLPLLPLCDQKREDVQ